MIPVLRSPTFGELHEMIENRPHKMAANANDAFFILLLYFRIYIRESIHFSLNEFGRIQVFFRLVCCSFLLLFLLLRKFHNCVL